MFVVVVESSSCVSQHLSPHKKWLDVRMNNFKETVDSIVRGCFEITCPICVRDLRVTAGKIIARKITTDRNRTVGSFRENVKKCESFDPAVMLQLQKLLNNVFCDCCFQAKRASSAMVETKL